MTSPASQSGFFVTFEGPEGSGKSTHLRLLSDYLSSRPIPYLLTREPGGSSVGVTIRDILLDKVRYPFLADYTELLLFMTDRIQHLEEVIRPALRSGTLVLCDRYADSTFAYQVGGKGISEDVIQIITDISGASLTPHFTILLDVDVRLGLTRAQERGADRFEAYDLAFHQRVREAYRLLAQRNPDRICLIETTNMTIDAVQTHIRCILQDRGIIPN